MALRKRIAWLFPALMVPLVLLLVYFHLEKAAPPLSADFQETSQEVLRPRVLTELEPAQVVVISELLFEEYRHTRRLIEVLLEAGAFVLMLANDPLDAGQKAGWLEKHGLNSLASGRLSVIPVVHDSYWVRDFNPVPVRLSPLIYDRYFLTDFRFRTEHSVEDAVSYQLALYLNLNLISAPLVMDGGNFMSDGESCIITGDLSLDSPETPTEDSVKKTFKDFFGCKNLHILYDTPHDHIDMFVKFIGPGTVLVNQLTPPAVESSDFSKSDLYLTHEFSRQLEKTAARLKKHFKVVRLPMPPVVSGIFRTYANSLIVNKTAIIPSFQDDMINENPFPDPDLLKKQEEETAAIFQKYGYKPVFINSDELIARGGAVHCVTSGLPANLKKIARKM